MKNSVAAVILFCSLALNMSSDHLYAATFDGACTTNPKIYRFERDIVGYDSLSWKHKGYDIEAIYALSQLANVIATELNQRDSVCNYDRNSLLFIVRYVLAKLQSSGLEGKIENETVRLSHRSAAFILAGVYDVGALGFPVNKKISKCWVSNFWAGHEKQTTIRDCTDLERATFGYLPSGRLVPEFPFLK